MIVPNLYSRSTTRDLRQRVLTSLLLVTLGSVMGSVTSTTVFAADLLSLYQEAIESDARLAGERFRYRADQQRVIQSRALLRPQVGFNGRYGLNRDEAAVLDEPDITDNYTSESVNFSVSQALYDREAKSGVDRSKGEVQLSALELNDTRQELALRVSVAYFDVLAAQDNLEVARSEMSAISRQLDLAREMLDVGLGTKTDLFDTEARFKLAEVSEIEALNDIEDALQSLQAITGNVPGELAALRSDAPVSGAEPGEVEYWISLGLARSLTVLKTDQAAEIARIQTEINRHGRSPTVDLVFNGGHSDREGSSNERSARDLSLQFNVPLYQGGAISSRVEQAHLLHQAALEDAKQVRRETERAIRNAFLDVDSNARRISALLQAVDASESAVQARQEGFAAGISTNLDVLDAQRDLFRARRDYLRARYDHIINLLELERAAGSLEDINISRINEWLSSDSGAQVKTEIMPVAIKADQRIELSGSAAPVLVSGNDVDLVDQSLGSTVATTAQPQTVDKIHAVPEAEVEIDVVEPRPIDENMVIPRLSGIGHQTLGVSSVRIDVELDDPGVRTYSFGYLSPNQLAIDFYDVQQGIEQPVFDIDTPLVHRVEAHQTDEHTQIILHLSQPVHFDNTAHRNGVVIVLRAADTTTIANSVPATTTD